ncbi:MAG: L-seryl-tRNA(Sec) selenium transferase [Gemmatimonadota bacterium]
MTDPRSSIPSVDKLLLEAAFVTLVDQYGHERVVQAIREVIADVRASIGSGEIPDRVADPDLYSEGVRANLAEADIPSLQSVVNGTGVVLHTNLGRAPLAMDAVEAMSRAARDYSNLEYDLGEGRRGSRYVHCVSLLTELTGAEDAVVVNNAAAGLMLILNTLARGEGVVVSRGELVEIGGGFRIPEILERSGAHLVEVGSTNRTRIADYTAALDGGGAAAVLKVHRSNFRVTGFTEEATLAELAAAAHAAEVPLVYDLGSGLMIDPGLLGVPTEPRPEEALAAGADLVVFSGDKLLGGPQAGIIVGRKDRVAELRANPMCRALRVDKTTLAGLEATLRIYRDPERAVHEIPTLRMLAASAGQLKERADDLASRLEAAGLPCAVQETHGAVGGGTYPGVTLPSWAVVPSYSCPAQQAADRLRAGTPPVVGRIVDDRLLLDVRTILPSAEDALLRRVLAVHDDTRSP